MKLIKRYISLHNDIMHLYLSGYLATLPKDSKKRIVGSSVVNRLFRCLKTFIRDFQRLFNKAPLAPQKRNWIVYETPNNMTSLRFLEELSDYEFVSVHQDKKISPVNQTHILHRFIFFYDFLFIPFLQIHLIFNPKRKLIWDAFYILFRTIGLYSSYRSILCKLKPESIVFANDHSLLQRSLLLAAKDLGIRTIYLQHATVSNYFPPLKFSLAFLEGMDAMEKYLKIGANESIIELIGMCKFDQYASKVRKSSKLKSIGVCFNKLDDLEVIKEIISSIGISYPEIEIVLRPHPSDNRSFGFKGCSLNDSNKVTAFEFLQNVDAIVSGNSSIILEAALMNVYPIYYSPMSKGALDYYGFVKNKLVEEVTEMEDLLGLLKLLKGDMPNIQHKASYYNEAVNGGFYGSSGQKLIRILQSYATNNHLEDNKNGKQLSTIKTS